ncbi:MAG: hypothetical protein AB7E76_08280 [Deferribacterales bacterium]
MARVAFVSNGLRTALFKAVADNLSASGHEIFWIITGSDEVKSIVAPYSHVLDISIITDTSEESLQLLDKYSEISVNGIIASDRILSKKDADFAHRYLASCFSNIHDFIISNKIEIVFGEATWANELVCAAVCRMCSTPYLAPSTVRHPSDRFAFFEGVFQSRPAGRAETIDISKGRELYAKFMAGTAKPFYMLRPKKNNLKLLIKHIKRHIRMDVYDMTVPSLYKLIADKVRTAVSVYPSSGMPKGRYVYMPLHVSPEASVDVLGGFHMDAVAFVSNVSRALPYGVELAVKGHPNQMQPTKFYKAISRIPSVRLVDKCADSIGLIKDAEAVVSVSGTACYEAGLLGVPAFTFADMFFNLLPSVKKCTSYEELYSVLKNLSKDENCTESAIAFLSSLYGLTYKGYAESETVFADALSEQNISDVTAGFIDIIEFYSSSKSATAASMCSRFI